MSKETSVSDSQRFTEIIQVFKLDFDKHTTHIKWDLLIYRKMMQLSLMLHKIGRLETGNWKGGNTYNYLQYVHIFRFVHNSCFQTREVDI